jgi:hypothetical protein
MMSKLKQDDTKDDMLDQALDDSFPASDPPSMTQPKSQAGSPEGKKTPEGDAKAREKDVDTGSKERTHAKKG